MIFDGVSCTLKHVTSDDYHSNDNNGYEDHLNEEYSHGSSYI